MGLLLVIHESAFGWIYIWPKSCDSRQQHPSVFWGIANIKKIVCNKALIQWFCRLHSDLPQCYNESIYFIA